MITKSHWFAFRVIGNEDGAEQIVQNAINRGAEVYSDNRFGILYHVLLYSPKPKTIYSMRVSYGRLFDPSFCRVDNPDAFRREYRRIGQRVKGLCAQTERR